MLRYFFHRLLIFFPMLIAISLLAFGLSKLAPGDPVELIIRAGAGAPEGNIGNSRRIYRETAAFLGLDKPAFYFAIAPRAYPDTLYRIIDKDHRTTLRKLIAQYGNWPRIADYYQQLRAAEAFFATLPDTLNPEAANRIRASIDLLYFSHRQPRISSLLDKVGEELAGAPALAVSSQPIYQQLRQRYAAVTEQPRRWLLYLPDLKWYGFDNQYHHWFSGFITGDWGLSYIDGRPVISKLRDALRWTLLMNLSAVILVFAIGIPLGVFSAVRQGQTFDRTVTVVLFMLYSLPAFWIGTILVVFLTTPEYGLDLFPTMGTGSLPPEAPFWQRFWDTAYHFILPVFCLTYGSLAFLTRQMRGGMLDVVRQDYIRTARAKGLSERKVIWKHAFRNALFPVITLFASVFPAMLAGSVIIEVIFNIPGMGKLTVDAIRQSNWPVVYAILMLGALLTMIGMLVADLLYAWADPRVRYRRR